MSKPGTSEEKKAYVLLNAIIFHYHGLDETEEKFLEELALENDAESELKWSYDFISQDYLSSFDRARDYLKIEMNKLEKSKRLHFIDATWKANFQKGYITEMEATAMLQLARDWEIDKDLIELVQEV